MADLWLAVKQEYFDQYNRGEKPEEFRLYNEYWKKRLIGRDYKYLHYRAGYPSKEQQKDRLATMPYRGYTIKTIIHPLFGNDPVKVFAIKLEPKEDNKDG